MIWIALHYVAVLACAARVFLRPHRDPTARVAWLAVLFALPVVGIIAYLLLGETSIGRSRVTRLNRILPALPPPQAPEAPNGEAIAPPVSDRYAQLFNVGRSISGYQPVGGNRARLMQESNTAIDEMISDIDAAKLPRFGHRCTVGHWLHPRKAYPVLSAVTTTGHSPKERQLCPPTRDAERA